MLTLLYLQRPRVVWYPGNRYAGFEGSMRRRSRRAPNLSESTGKIGQELPANQPAPLIPSYGDRGPVPAAAAPAPREQAPREQAPRPPREPRTPAPQRPSRSAQPDWNQQAGVGRLEVETQPEMPSQPPPEPQAADRSPQAPKGYVVL